MYITPEYREQNAALHRTNAAYGTSGHRWAKAVDGLAMSIEAKTVLDYGCGKSTLAAAVSGAYDLRQFDPAVEMFATAPEPADLVVCTDVLEHIEPEFLDRVLDDLRRLTLRAAFLVVATRPAKKVLPDGRNAHLIVEPAHTWLPSLMQRWRLKSFIDLDGEFQAVLLP